jgi:hypothetical protein
MPSKVNKFGVPLSRKWKSPQRSVSETLYRAATLMSGRGKWARGARYSGNGAHCAVGALNAVDGAFEVAATAVVAKHLYPRGFPRDSAINSLIYWNDMCAKGQSEVVAAFRAAARKARAAERSRNV